MRYLNQMAGTEYWICKEDIFFGRRMLITACLFTIVGLMLLALFPPQFGLIIIVFSLSGLLGGVVTLIFLTPMHVMIVESGVNLSFQRSKSLFVPYSKISWVSPSLQKTPISRRAERNGLVGLKGKLLPYIIPRSAAESLRMEYEARMGRSLPNSLPFR